MKIYRPFLSLTLVGLAVIGCTNKVPDFERAAFTINNQRIEVLTTFDLIDNYLSHSGKFNGNIVKSSDKYIYKPIRDEILMMPKQPSSSIPLKYLMKQMII